MTIRRAIVFGGTGFLGRRIVAALVNQGIAVGVAARNPSRASSVIKVDADGTRIELLKADVTDRSSIVPAVAGADAVVNCVSLYVESGKTTYQAVHVDGARNVAEAAANSGVKQLVHISGIGSDSSSPSGYVRARGDGEKVVRHAFPDAVILRPSVMFGRGDAFLSTIAQVAGISPVIPLFGIGDTKLQPVSADDVAEAAVRAITAPRALAGVYEIGGPEVVTYRTIVERVLDWTGRRRFLLPFPFVGWRLLATAAQVLPAPPLTEGQVALMKQDNVVGHGTKSLSDLGLAPRPMADVAPAYLTGTT